MNFQQSWLYWLAGIVLLIVSVMSWQDKANPRRVTTGLFWAFTACCFCLATGRTHWLAINARSILRSGWQLYSWR